MTSKNFTVKVADISNAHAIFELAILSAKENGIFDISERKIKLGIESSLDKNNSICGVIVGSDGGLQGFIVLDIGELWYSEDKLLHEREVFVHPDFREAKGGRARALCEFAKSVASSLHLPLYAGVVSNGKTEAKVRLYERQFGKPNGAFFLYGANAGNSGNATEH